MSALYHIAQNDPPKLLRPEHWSEIFLDFISVCLKKEPEDRPTSVELLKVGVACGHMMLWVSQVSPCVQHQLLSRSSEYTNILYQLVHRTQEAVRQMDNQSYKRLQKMLMHGVMSIEEDDREEIESEPPRYVHACAMCMHVVGTCMWTAPCTAQYM